MTPGASADYTDLVTCATCEQCDPAAGCVARPQPSFSCDVMATAILTLSVAKPAAPVVSWRRTEIDTDTSPVFRPVGDPRVDTEYTLCVFDAVGLVAEAVAPPAGTCGARPCWRGTRTGFQYHDRARASDGLEQIDLRAKDPLHGILKLKAKGSNLHLPASLAGVASPVVAELRAHNTAHDQCWQSSFPSDATKRRAKTLAPRPGTDLPYGAGFCPGPATPSYAAAREDDQRRRLRRGGAVGAAHDLLGVTAPGGATGRGRLPVSTEYVARYHPPLTFSSLYSRTQKACVAGSTVFDASKPSASAARQPASASCSGTGENTANVWVGAFGKPSQETAFEVPTF